MKTIPLDRVRPEPSKRFQAKVFRLYQEGLTVEDLAKKFHLTPDRIKEICERFK
jgi:hypothetical protein